MTKAIYRLGNLCAESVSNYRGNSYLMICPICGELWASVICEGSEFFPSRRPCIKHQWAGMVPGSIMTHIEDSRYWGPRDHYVTPDGMPREILLRELEVHLQDYERGTTE